MDDIVNRLLDGADDQGRGVVQEAANEIERLREALRIAKQFMQVASDWNLDEVEVDGEMRSTYDYIEMMESALNPPQPSR